MIEGVPESLQAVHAGGLAGRRAILDDLSGDGDDLVESIAQLVEQPRAAEHRVPEKRVDFLSVDVAPHENLQVVQVHVQHASGCKADRL